MTLNTVRQNFALTQLSINYDFSHHDHIVLDFEHCKLKLYFVIYLRFFYHSLKNLHRTL